MISGNVSLDGCYRNVAQLKGKEYREGETGGETDGDIDGDVFSVFHEVKNGRQRGGDVCRTLIGKVNPMCAE